MFQPSWFKELLGTNERGTAADERPPQPMGTLTDEPVLVAFATQTGAAEAIAEATLEQLELVGRNAAMVDFYDLDLPLLAKTRQVLFVVSTTCDGDPPDMAEEFHEQAMASPAALGHLHYAVLALGDRDYDEFCGFGHRLDDWLRASGAQPWFDCVEVDDEDEQALTHWHDAVDALMPASTKATASAR